MGAHFSSLAIGSRDLALERRLSQAIAGDVLGDAFTRGRYATDASIYQILPRVVVLPKSAEDLAAVLAIAKEAGVSVTLRGAGTSQNGQPLGDGIIVDCSRHFNALDSYDAVAGEVTVQPGHVLERLNTRLRGDGWFFPVEPSTATRCTIGGMTGNNSCGARSIRYGKMVDNVLGVDALLADGQLRHFGPGAADPLQQAMLAIADRERSEIAAMYPKVQRRVGGYNLDSLILPQPNLAHLLVGSEGTLAAFTRIRLKLSRLPKHRVIGVCQFPSFHDAMVTTKHLVALGPVAVELVDNNVLTLGDDIPAFKRTLGTMTRGKPDSLLIVEFAGDDLGALQRDLKRLDTCMADHGFADAVVEITDPAAQKQVWEVREACLNIMMSMKGDGKPVSFIEDCAVPLDHLADYTAAITALFARHGTRGTWYAHASVGCLHVRPILNMKDTAGLAAMRAIAEEASALVRQFKGSYSGEHGDGLSRSEFIAPLFGERLTRAFEEVKDAFDPENRLNPHKIVRPPRFDERDLMRYPADYAAEPMKEALDWSDWGGFSGAVEMCNNNGTCRKVADGAMCPSFRATKDETHVTRGRANALRLALSGQLGADALTSPDMKEAMSLCVGCKACKRECPTGVDMARMKVEVLRQFAVKHGHSLRDRLVAYLPHYAPYAAMLAPLLNLRDKLPGLAKLSEMALGFSAARTLPKWRSPWRDGKASTPEAVQGDGRDIVLFADTFNRAFDASILYDAANVLEAAGYRLHAVVPHGRALCCGRTFLSTGMVEQARAEARRTLDALLPFVARGARVVGLEPSCLLTLRDEFFALLPRHEVTPLAEASFLIEEVLAADLKAGRITLGLLDQGGRKALLHGHCHQKAHDAMGAVETVLKAVPGLTVETIASSCCGMAGAFGYQAETIAVSKAMGELSLLPAIRNADDETWIIADGTSCRHQIADGAKREARHVVSLLAACLERRV